MQEQVQAVYEERKACLLCAGEKFNSILDLGNLHLNAFPKPGEEAPAKAPLHVVRCEECGLLQLKHTVNQDLLYREYWYRSGTNQSMRDALLDVVSNLPVELRPWDTVVDIGSNDNTLLEAYTDRCSTEVAETLHRVGFEPSNIGAEVAGKNPNITVVNDYFTSLPPLWGKAKVVTSIAMFYGLRNPHPFIQDVKTILHPDGVWILQLAYLPSILQRNAFDGICHEHVAYYSLSTLERLLKQHDLHVFDAKLVPVNEGSIRLYISPRQREESTRLQSIRYQEYEANLDSLTPYAAFGQRVQRIGERLVGYLSYCRKLGEKVHGYGASTKGNTLLQAYGIDSSLVQKVWERQPQKWGRQTVTGIPIVSEAQGREERPDFLLILPWHFSEEFIQREADYLANGGRIIIPLPEFKVVEV